MLTTVGPGTWVAAMSPSAPFVPKNGVVAANGGLSQIGSEQTSYLAPDPTYAKDALVPVFRYQVTALSYGIVTLSLTTGLYGGYECCETNKSNTLGTLMPVTIGIGIPDPATMALLALGSLMLVRRRS